jgi:hypothetical protein
MEELPSETIVEGEQSTCSGPRDWTMDVTAMPRSVMLTLLGHYRALLWNDQANEWRVDEQVGIHVNVEVCTECARTALLSLNESLAIRGKTRTDLTGIDDWTHRGQDGWTARWALHVHVPRAWYVLFRT